MNWTTFKDAVQAWFATATGLTVVWANQNAPTPTGVYGSLLVTSVRELGAGEVSFVYDKTKPAGADMIPSGTIHNVITVSCQVHVPEPTQGTAWSHTTRATHYTERARASLRLPAPLALLRASNIAHVRSEPTQDLSGVWGGTWSDRAAVDVHFAYAGVIVDSGTSYIKTADVDGDIDGNLFSDTIGA